MRAAALGRLARYPDIGSAIVSGGLQDATGRTESHEFVDFARSPEVGLRPDFPVALDTEGVYDTTTSAASVAKMVGLERLGDPYAFVTSRTHMPRAYAAFREAGFTNLIPMSAERLAGEFSPEWRAVAQQYTRSFRYAKRVAIEGVLRGLRAVDPNGVAVRALARRARSRQLAANNAQKTAGLAL